MSARVPAIFSTFSPTLTTALKEWAVAVNALVQGKTIVLLRKGGIREPGGSFAIEQSQFWLYPTYEHQKPHLLKPDYASQVTPVGAGWHPAQVEIQAWATITHSFQVSEIEPIEALLPFHVWNLEFVSERLKWKPKLPLSVLLLRVYCLPQVQMIPYVANYGGCKSWIELEISFPSIETPPALSETEYLHQVESIRSVLQAGR